MEVSQDNTIFNYLPTIPHKYVESKNIIIVAGPGVNSEPMFLPGNSKEKIGKEITLDELIMDNL